LTLREEAYDQVAHTKTHEDVVYSMQ